MKKLIRFLLITALTVFSSNVLAVNSEYCERVVSHFNLDGDSENPSAIVLTIANIDANSFYVEILSNNSEDPIDVLIVNGVTGFTGSDVEILSSGAYKKTFTTSEAAPDSISMEILWSKVSSGGNWMLNTFTVPFNLTCIAAEDDTEAPANFTASINATNFKTVEFNLSATDNSGKVTYDITYGTTTVSTIGNSGEETKYTLEGLTETTAYSFSIIAKDAGNNTASNNPIILTTTTKTLPTLAAAPTAPTREASDVISVYSDAYTSIATNLNPGWGQATVFSELDFSSNMVLKYEGLNYQGLEYTNSDISSMLFVHLDYWTADATAFQFFLIAGGENAYDIAANEGITIGEWVGIDIPLSYFEDAGRDLTSAYQFKTVGDGTIHLDNIYFWKNPTSATEDVTLSTLLVGGEAIADFTTAKLSYAIDLPYGTTTVPAITVTTTNANAQSTVTAATSIPGTTTIDVVSESGNTNMKYTVNFTATMPTSAAPKPSNKTEDVIAVYSGEYSMNIASNLSPGWGQSTLFSTVELDGDEAMKYGNLNYQGLEYTNSDVSSMEYVHLDYWTTDATAFQFFLIAEGENAYDIATTTDGIQMGKWVSLDIPLSYFSEAGRNLTVAIQFKTVGNGTIYLDNLYFWKMPTAQNNDATLSSLLVDGDSISNFTSTKMSYDYDLPYGTTTIPTVTATPTSSSAVMTITPATTIPGVTNIKVISESGTDTITYMVNFSDNIPLTKAPTPTEVAENVIAVYSDAYANTIATNLNPGWGQATQFSILTVEENEMMKYGNLNYQGTEYAETDVSAMEFLHFDYWTKDATALEFFLIADGENSYNVATELGIKTGEWVSVDISLKYFSDAGRDLTKAFQFKVVGDGTINFDNFYFYKNDAASNNEVAELSLSLYPNPATDIVSITSETTITSMQVYSLAGRKMIDLSPNSNDFQMDISALSRGAYFINLTANGASKTIKLLKR